ncbi:tail fiber protein [Pseudomonas phage WP1]
MERSSSRCDSASVRSVRTCPSLKVSLTLSVITPRLSLSSSKSILADKMAIMALDVDQSPGMFERG